MHLRKRRRETNRQFHRRVLGFIVYNRLPELLQQLNESMEGPTIDVVEIERLLQSRTCGDIEPDISVAYHVGDQPIGTFFEVKSMCGETPNAISYNALRELASQVSTLRGVIENDRQAVVSYFMNYGVPRRVATRMELSAHGLYRVGDRIKIYRTVEFPQDG